jgi:putative ABC transport system substrate-binding protein
MRRREFITLLGGGAAAAWPVVARAQQAGRIYRLGLMTPSGRETPHVSAFFDELRLNGFVEGKNLTVITLGNDIPEDQIAERAAALVNTAPDAIQTGYPRALKVATQTIPLVGTTEDMIGEGIVTSLARPGGNITGVSILSRELDGKRQDFLIEAAPAARRIAVFAQSNISPPGHIQDLQNAANARSLKLSFFTLSKPEEFGPAIHAAKADGAEAINFLAAPLFSVHRRAVFEAVNAMRLPAIYQWPEMAEDGGLVAYGSRLAAMYRQSARLVVRVLRGAKPADLPVEQPTLFQLAINLKAARAIGHDIPAGLVLRADNLIE